MLSHFYLKEKAQGTKKFNFLKTTERDQYTFLQVFVLFVDFPLFYMNLCGNLVVLQLMQIYERYAHFYSSLRLSLARFMLHYIKACVYLNCVGCRHSFIVTIPKTVKNQMELVPMLFMVEVNQTWYISIFLSSTSLRSETCCMHNPSSTP